MSQHPEQVFKVVVNDEEQYSIWPDERDNALGWRDAGKRGTREDCLAWIEEHWTDMRPLSVRRRHDATAAESSTSSTT
jgi:MbtH protein